MKNIPLLIVLICILCPLPIFAQDTATFELIDGTTYTNVQYFVNHYAETVIITAPESGQRTIIIFAAIKVVRNADNKDITLAVLTPPPEAPHDTTATEALPPDTALVPAPVSAPAPQPTTRPPDLKPDSVWIEQPSAHTVDIRDKDSSYALKVYDSRDGERNFRYAFRLGGYYSFPDGWDNKINSAPGIEGQFLIGLKNAAIGVHASHASYDLDSGYIALTADPGVKLIGKETTVRVDQYHVTGGVYFTLGKSRILSFFELGIGAYHRRLEMIAIVRTQIISPPEDIVVWEESQTGVSIVAHSGVIFPLTSVMGLSLSFGYGGYIDNGRSATFDLPAPYTPPDNSLPDGQAFDIKLSVVILQ